MLPVGKPDPDQLCTAEKLNVRQISSVFNLNFDPPIKEKNHKRKEKKQRLLHDQFISFAVDIDDFDGFVIFQMLTKLGDVNIHTAGIKIVIVDPDRF